MHSGTWPGFLPMQRWSLKGEASSKTTFTWLLKYFTHQEWPTHAMLSLSLEPAASGKVSFAGFKQLQKFSLKALPTPPFLPHDPIDMDQLHGISKAAANSPPLKFCSIMQIQTQESTFIPALKPSQNTGKNSGRYSLKMIGQNTVLQCAQVKVGRQTVLGNSSALQQPLSWLYIYRNTARVNSADETLPPSDERCQLNSTWKLEGEQGDTEVKTCPAFITHIHQGTSHNSRWKHVNHYNLTTLKKK